MHAVNRRSFVKTLSLAAGAGLFVPRLVLAQQAAPAGDRLAQQKAAAANAKITTQKLRGDVSVLMGSGGNIAVMTGKDGKLVVDSGYSTSKPQVLEAMNAISADEIALLINTHWHFDHTDGNEWMHQAGAQIIAHEKTAQRLSTTQHIAAFNMTVPPSPAGALPTRTFATDYTVDASGAKVMLKHYDPAHTDTDISVLFPEEDILHTGDTWFNGVYPFIDYSTGGNIDGMIRATKRNMETGTQNTIIIPGHGPVGNKQQLEATLEMLEGIRENVAKLKQQGKSKDEAVAAKPTAKYDAKFGGGSIAPDVFTGFVYQGV